MSCRRGNELVPFFRMGQMVHFELVHLLFLGVHLAPLHVMVKEEVLIGVSLLCLGTLVKEELTQPGCKEAEYGGLFGWGWSGIGWPLVKEM